MKRKEKEKGMRKKFKGKKWKCEENEKKMRRKGH